MRLIFIPVFDSQSPIYPMISVFSSPNRGIGIFKKQLYNELTLQSKFRSPQILKENSMKKRSTILLLTLTIAMVLSAFIVGKASASTGCSVNATNSHWVRPSCWLEEQRLFSLFGSEDMSTQVRTARSGLKPPRDQYRANDPYAIMHSRWLFSRTFHTMAAACDNWYCSFVQLLWRWSGEAGARGGSSQP